MKTERELFEAWVKKEHAHIYIGSENGNCRFKMDIDFMFAAWQASASRDGYKLVKDDVHTRISESNRLSRYG